MHKSDDIDVSTGEDRKPEFITFYNGTKGGVDTVDQLCSNYNCAIITRRWPMVVFLFITECGRYKLFSSAYIQ